MLTSRGRLAFTTDLITSHEVKSGQTTALHAILLIHVIVDYFNSFGTWLHLVEWNIERRVNIGEWSIVRRVNIGEWNIERRATIGEWNIERRANIG